jgi:excisionase family DNA binding protein
MMDTAQQDRMLTAREVATMLHVTLETLRRWDKTNQLRAARTPGGYRRYRLSDIQRLLTPTANPRWVVPGLDTSKQDDI